jgi:hypothetical protein
MPATFNVFDHLPQFGIYPAAGASPMSLIPADYTAPPGVTMWWNNATWYSVVKLTPAQQAAIGSDLAARVTYFAQCDNYDRIGGIFFLREPPGQMPKQTDLQTEIVRFITPFSDYGRGPLATHVYPDADLSAYAQVLADPTHDIWIGIAGGSNPQPICASLSKDLQMTGFRYSLDFVSNTPLVVAPSTVLSAVVSDTDASTPTAIAYYSALSTPIAGTFSSSGDPLTGHVTIIVSGHGSNPGPPPGDEYENTDDTVTVAGKEVGLFSTKIDCAPYAAASPDGNPGIFQGNNTSYNPRNWCPGALVPSHTFTASLAAGTTPVVLSVSPPQVPMGSTYVTSIMFSSP